ncbi:BRWD3 [Bugula neritina]|uniref:BRWD3 n=1 Tax=Bugula neritina TaxID=10212 RepID=A0A7J7KF68_BUGNE|nr:BRWD3 [Bugula neritina]
MVCVILIVNSHLLVCVISIVSSQPAGMCHLQRERVVVDQDIPQTLNHAVSSQLSSDVMPVQRSSNQDSSNSNTQSEQLESERQHLAELEEAQLISDRKQLSFYTGEQTSSSLRAGHMRTRRGRAGTSRPGDSGRETGEQVIRNRLAARALYDTDVESEAGQSSSPPSGESSTDEEPEVRPVRARRGVTHNGMQSDGGSYVDLTSASESGDSSSNYSDWEVQNKTVLQPPSRVSRRKSRSKKGGIVSNSVTLTTGEESTEESDAESRRGQLPLPENTKELEDCFNPDWLTTDSPQKSPYFPQMGDEVMYFYRGHKSYVDRVRNIRLYDPKNLPWEKVSTLRMAGSRLAQHLLSDTMTCPTSMTFLFCVSSMTSQW